MLAPVAWRRTLPLAAGTVALLLATASRYGWHRDELYFLEAGKHLQWGYVDQPPLTPALARLAHEIAPGNLVVLRTAPAIATGVLVVVAALLVRELGGRSVAQTLGAAAVAFGGFALGVGHLLATATFDLLAWTTLLWLLLRVLRTGDPRGWVPFGIVAGAALLNKDLVVLLVVSMLVGIVVAGRGELLRSRHLVVGVALALVIASPNLTWQASHGWPQLEMAQALSDRLAVENRVTLVPLQLVFAGPLLVYLLWRGARWFVRAPEAAQLRAVPVMWGAALALTLATAGRPYYCLPLTVTVLLGGIVATERRDERARRTLTWLIAANSLLSLPVALPLLPADVVADSPLTGLNEVVTETFGWPELADQIAAVVADLPDQERERVVLLAASYGEAGAIDRFGPARSIGPAYSPHNGYWDFRRPHDDAAMVVAVRYAVEDLREHLVGCRQVATVDNGRAIENEAQGQPIVVCAHVRGSWEAVWPKLRRLS